MPSASNSNCRLGAKRLRIKFVGINAMMAAALLAITVLGRASVDEVARWNQVATDAASRPKLIRSGNRIFAILHVAIHVAANAVEPRYEPYQPRTSPAPAGPRRRQPRRGGPRYTCGFTSDSKATFDAALEESFAPSPRIEQSSRSGS